MDCQVAAAMAISARRAAATEPSPVFVHTQITVSRMRRIDPEDVTNESESAQERSDHLVSMPEQSESQSVDDARTTAFLGPELNNLSAAVERCCQNYGGDKFIKYYKKAWTAINSDYAIPIWLLLLSVPMSAGIMGSLYMYSCPASPLMAETMFTIGISLMAIISFRICLILRRITIVPSDECHKTMQALMLISLSVTILFFISESTSYWKMTSSPHRYAPNFCDPRFETFSFWWNCIMCVLIVPVTIFPV